MNRGATIPAAEAQPLLLSITAAARALTCNPETVRRMVRSGRLPHMRLNGMPTGPIRIPIKDLERFIAREVSRQSGGQHGDPCSHRGPIPVSDDLAQFGTVISEREC